MSDIQKEPQQDISWILFMSTVKNYKITLQKLFLNIPDDKKGIFNLPDMDVLSIFPQVVTVWESYFYHNLFSDITVDNLKIGDHIVYEMEDQVEKWSILDKAYFIPKMIFQKTFDKSSLPFQDFAKIIQIRNAITHYRASKIPLKTVQDLIQRKIAYNEHNVKMPWTMQIGTECGRWAIETLIAMIEKFGALFPENAKPFMEPTLRQFYEQEIGSYIKKFNLTSWC